MSHDLLHEALVVLAAMCIAVPLFKRLKLGAILGYLAAGVLIGPHVLGLVTEGEDILGFSELGVVFFLFLIGIELEPRRLWQLRRAVFGLGTAQVVVTAAVIGGALAVLGVPLRAAVVGGIGLALSSSVISLQLLAERGEIQTPAGRDGFAILLYQDVAVIPVLALIPLLAGDAGDAAPGAALSVGAVLLGALKVLAAVAVIVFGGRLVTRPVFRIIASSRAHEVSVAVALLVVVGAGALMVGVGMSMALGAFLAGVLLADSEYRHELEANVEPFKGLLLGLFFMAIGMTANITLFIDKPLVIFAGVAALIALKVGVVYGVGRIVGWERQSRVLVSAAMSTGGAFAFVLLGVAAQARVMSQELVDTLVIVVSTSMAAAPLLMIGADRYVARLRKAAPKREFDALDDETHPVIIAGFGRYGQVIARVLALTGHKFTALEISPEQVDFLRKWGNKSFYGDASRLDLLRAARAEEAQAFVLAIDDVEASVRTAQVVKKNFPTLPIYARARNRQHAYKLMDLGVTVFNRETFFSSLKMAEEVLVGLGHDKEDAADLCESFARMDEEILSRQHAVSAADQKQLIQTSIQIRAELEQTFEQDIARHRAGRLPPTPPAPPAAPPPEPPEPPAAAEAAVAEGGVAEGGVAKGGVVEGGVVEGGADKGAAAEGGVDKGGAG